MECGWAKVGCETPDDLFSVVLIGLLFNNSDDFRCETFNWATSVEEGERNGVQMLIDLVSLID